MSATPYLSDPRKSLVAFTSVAFRYPAGQAIADGVLCPFSVDYYRGENEPDTDALSFAWAMSQRGAGLVTCSSIADAEDVAARWTAMGLPTIAVHSDLPAREIKKRLLRAEKYPVDGPPFALAYNKMLSEGVNIVSLTWLARRALQPSPIDVTQSVGRVLRVFPGKDRAAIYDAHAHIALGGLTRQEAVGVYEAVLNGDPEAIRKLTRPAQQIAVLAEATAVSELDGWCASLSVALVGAGVPVMVKPPQDMAWASEGQQRVLRKAYGLVRYMPKAARDTVYALLDEDVIPGLSGVAASNLIACVEACDVVSKDARRSWSRHLRTAGKVHGKPVAIKAPVVDVAVLDAMAIDALRERRRQTMIWEEQT
jgi:hypothetical protein